MGHFFHQCVKQYSKYLQERWLFSNKDSEFARVFALPGKAVRIEMRSAPGNISTKQKLGGVSGEGEEPRETQRWSKRSTEQLASSEIHPKHSPLKVSHPQGYLQSRQWWRRRQFQQKDGGGGRDRRKCVSKCNFQGHLSFTVFKVRDWISL